MRTSTLWTEKITGENGDSCVYDACFSPDGSNLVAAVGFRVLVISVTDGSIIQTLKGHKSAVYCVAYSNDGKRFASGGADKNVIIWTDNLQGSLKYVHGDSIQCLAYNPQSQQLASCSVNDFGLWTPEKKSVDKHKVSAKINACSWTSDGLHLALGLGNGTSGSEYARFERPGGSSSPVWGLAWGKTVEEGNDMLCVADWGQTLSFYDIQGKQIMKDRALGFDPVRVVYARTHRDCEYIIVAGSNKACTIFTQEGVKVTSITEQESWVWACSVKPDSQCLVVGTQAGVLTSYEVQLLVVHALYKSLYAFRMNMTDVMVQNLLKDLRTRIKCRDVIKKLAIFKDSLAIQFVDRVLIYQRDAKEFKYTLKDKISQSFECSLLVMCSENVILCQEKKLQCYSFHGMRQREWVLNSHIRYIRSVGGMRGKEVLLAGLKNGQVVKIFLDNPFPIDMVKVPQSVRCVDLNLLHSKIAVVDESEPIKTFNSFV
ncbi:Vegetative incompatibility protein HET-E-1 [Folsomia candida]|uniref:Intraflagellar transport protein 122 homolog n=1 Tax=Folsomia candida TaxID=158441 RepID=A0A226EKI8_FOLCA|nr:Vegetative incompatibility protein HET-E-1 [Folsomia candida]